LGHSIGDAILQKVAKRLHLCVRESDTISRQGGDEFLLILPEINDPEDVRAIADKLIQTFEKPFTVHNQLLSVSASIGIAIYPYHGDDFNNLLKNSDVAMYKAKESGKNTYCFYTKKMNRDIIDQFKIESDLKSALQNNEFILHYQPQIDLATNTIAGVEALIRWNHPQHGMIPPLSFIPIAEGSGQIVQIGQWVIEEACRQAALWHSLGITVRVAVNISATQFKRGNLETVVKDALKLSGLNPKFFELELTESTMMHNLESTLQMVQSLKALGVQLSIDDFGTGYSSLAYLKRFAVDTLKIDQSFVRDIVQDQEDTVIVNTIIQMAKSLNLKTIAEGVENLDVLAILEDFGCNEVQGYHYAKPMEASEFERYFTSQLHTK
jgi:predicted signal transduction protein with EAL and GGDEF domain